MRNSLKLEVLRLWNEVKRISELRNVVAHGPMLWSENADGTLIGVVPNMKKALKSKPNKVVEYADVATAVDDIAAVHRKLEELLEIVAADLGIQAPASQRISQ